MMPDCNKAIPKVSGPHLTGNRLRLPHRVSTLVEANNFGNNHLHKTVAGDNFPTIDDLISGKDDILSLNNPVIFNFSVNS